MCPFDTVIAFHLGIWHAFQILRHNELLLTMTAVTSGRERSCTILMLSSVLSHNISLNGSWNEIHIVVIRNRTSENDMRNLPSPLEFIKFPLSIDTKMKISMAYVVRHVCTINLEFLIQFKYLDMTVEQRMRGSEGTSSGSWIVGAVGWLVVSCSYTTPYALQFLNFLTGLLQI